MGKVATDCRRLPVPLSEGTALPLQRSCESSIEETITPRLERELRLLQSHVNLVERLVSLLATDLEIISKTHIECYVFFALMLTYVLLERVSAVHWALSLQSRAV